jgi:hypothetical protein
VVEQHTYKSEFCVIVAPKHWPADPATWTSVAFHKCGGVYRFADLEDLVYYVKHHTCIDVTSVAKKVRAGGKPAIVYAAVNQWQISRDEGEYAGNTFRGDPSRPDLISVQEQRRMAEENSSGETK